MTPTPSDTPLIIDGLFFFPHKPWVDIPWPPALGSVAGHIAEGTRLLAGWTVIGRNICFKGIIAIRTFPMSH
jgi:hypothetical protein